MTRRPTYSGTYPGERMIILAERRREWRAGVSAIVAIAGAAIGSWLILSTPQDPSTLAGSLVPAAEAATRIANPAVQPYGLDRAGPIEEAQADTTAKPDVPQGQQMQASIPLTHDDIVKVQEKLKALGFDPGGADGRPGKRTLQALNEYRKSLGLQPTEVVDRQAVAPLTP